MPKYYPSIPPHLSSFVLNQSVFFTATAPTHANHINCSPKGFPSSTFSILSPNLCAYIDFTGSGAETIAHIYENGRVTIMFCSFGPNPNIIRFFCKGRVVEWNQDGFTEWMERMGKERVEGARAVVILDIWKVQSSCGFGVPRLPDSKSASDDVAEFPIFGPQEKVGDRNTIIQAMDYLAGKNKTRDYQAEWNAKSLDGLPGMRVARKDNGEVLWWGDLKERLRKASGHKDGLGIGFVLGLVLAWSLKVLGGLL